jgi:hypothetical protein
MGEIAEPHAKGMLATPRRTHLHVLHSVAGPGAGLWHAAATPPHPVVLGGPGGRVAWVGAGTQGRDHRQQGGQQRRAGLGRGQCSTGGDSNVPATVCGMSCGQYHWTPGSVRMHVYAIGGVFSAEGVAEVPTWLQIAGLIDCTQQSPRLCTSRQGTETCDESLLMAAQDTTTQVQVCVREVSL